jgi:hypothetical protein
MHHGRLRGRIHGLDPNQPTLLSQFFRHPTDMALGANQSTDYPFTEYRRRRDWAAWKNAMWDAGLKLPTQLRDGRARGCCGTPIDIPGTAQHIFAAHMSRTHEHPRAKEAAN